MISHATRGSSGARIISTAAESRQKPAVMNGTIAPQASEIRFKPPDAIISAVRAMAAPQIRRSSPKIPSSAPATAFTCTMHPMLSASSRQSSAKSPPRNAPSRAWRLSANAFFMYMGAPPRIRSPSRRRCLTPSTVSEYLSEAASRAESHIQNTAPGPPHHIAADTPTIFPTPRVPASARDSARSGETEVPGFLSGPALTVSVFFRASSERAPDLSARGLHTCV